MLSCSKRAFIAIGTITLCTSFLIAADNKDQKKTSRFSKTTRAKDFAVGLIDAGKLQHGLANDGRLGTVWGFNSQQYLALPGAWFKGYGYIADLSMMMGIPEGPWTPKYKNPAGSDSLSMGPSVSESVVASDWGPRANSYGRLHSGNINAKQIASRGSPPTYPVMATSTIPDTWPEGYYDKGNFVSTPGVRHWPGPWAVDPGPDGIARTADDSVLVGQFTGDKEIFFSMNDYDPNDQGKPYAFAGGGNQGYPLNVQFDIHGVGYGRSFAEDFIFFPMKIVYTGKDTLYGVYLGFYLDVDAPEYNASGTINHREDWMAFLRSQYEPALDTVINYNMAYIYDQQSGGIGPYTGPGPIAYTAIKLLETPKATEDIDFDGDGTIDVKTGNQLGITDWHWFRWENRPGVIKTEFREWEQYKLLSGGSKVTLWDAKAKKWGKFRVSQGEIFKADTLSDSRVIQLQSVHTAPDAWFHPDSAGKINPHFDDYKIIEKSSFDLDCVFIMSSGPFTLKPGDSTTFSFALIMGESFNDLKLNARTSQLMYNLNYLGADPPRTPKVTAVPGDKRVTLYWDDGAESSKDILTRYKDFEGYKIYRASVHPTNNKWGQEIRDGQGNVVGFQPIGQYDLSDGISGLDPMYPYLDRGSNTGLRHMFIDSTVENGKTYWYAVTAYDQGISVQNDPSLNPQKFAELNYLENAKGNNPAQTPNLVEVTPGRKPFGYVPPSAGKFTPDPDSLGKGTLTVNLIDPDLASASHTYTIFFDTSSTGKLLYTVKDEKGTIVVDKSDKISGSDAGPIFGGVRLTINENTSFSFRNKKWLKVSKDTSNFVLSNPRATANALPSDYVIQFYDRGIPNMMGIRAYNITLDPGRTKTLLDTVVRANVDSALHNFGLLETVKNVPGTATWNITLSWQVLYLPLDTTVIGNDTTIHFRTVRPQPPSFGDEYLYRTNKPMRPGDSFQFKVEKYSYTSSMSSEDLKNVRVVPNPYMVTAEWEQSATQKRLAFSNLPPTCTIYIYTLTGELVKKIERNSIASDMEWWNLLNSSNRIASYGLYIYVVETPSGGKTIGKFALIR